MDLHLQNVRTGETFKLAPDRTLIGNADHATVRTAAGDVYLAALAVRYPTGWALFGLSAAPEVTFNRRPFRAVERVTPRRGDLLAVGDERFTFVVPGSESPPEPPEPIPPPPCFAYITNPDGLDECRAVDHDLLFGRMDVCHVQLANPKLSRLGALLAADGGLWYAHTLSKKPIGRNRKAVHDTAVVADGDELLIGPLVVRLEIRPEGGPPEPRADSKGHPALPPVRAGSADGLARTDDGAGAPTESDGFDLADLRARAEELERWLKGKDPPAHAPRTGLGGWLDSQRDRLRRFWLDTPETTSARGLRAARRMAAAFAVLDRAVRTRPDGPELLRELYRLYDALGFADLCFRPLRQIEKLAEARGTPDPWVLEELARLCERLGPDRPALFDRAIAYWAKLEAATGVNYSRQRAATLALRAIHDRGGTARRAPDADGSGG
jgi:hypothetical protein